MSNAVITMILQQTVRTDYTQVWVTAIGALVIIVPAILNYLQNRKTAEKVVTLAASLVDNDGKQKIDKVTEKVGQLAEHINGSMVELKESIAARGLAEGELKGAKAEQERTALITEPAKVHDALNGAAVRQQIDNIEARLNEKNGLTGEDTPVLVHDEAVVKEIKNIVTPKLDSIQDSVDKK